MRKQYSKVETKQVMIFRHEETQETRTIEVPLPAVGRAIFDAIRKEFPKKAEADKWVMEKAWTE